MAGLAESERRLVSINSGYHEERHGVHCPAAQILAYKRTHGRGRESIRGRSRSVGFADTTVIVADRSWARRASLGLSFRIRRTAPRVAPGGPTTLSAPQSSVGSAARADQETWISRVFETMDHFVHEHWCGRNPRNSKLLDSLLGARVGIRIRMRPAAGSASTHRPHSERHRPTTVRIGEHTRLQATAEILTVGCLPTSPVAVFHPWPSIPRLPGIFYASPICPRFVGGTT